VKHLTASTRQEEGRPAPGRKRLRRLMRRLLRWSAAALASLAVFAVIFWAWEALGLPPAGPDRVIVAPAVATIFSAAMLAALSRWAERDDPDLPRGYLSRMSSLGPEEVYPIRPGTWRIGRDRRSCKIVVPSLFPSAGGEHADLICDDTRFWVKGLHDNGTYINDKLIPLNEKQPFDYDQQISLAGPSYSQPEKCTYRLTRQPQPWPRAVPTLNEERSETMAVLMLLADPGHGSPLELDHEFNVIRKTVFGARYSGQVLLEPTAPSSLADLGDKVQQFRPSVLHISGIGSDKGEERGIALPVGRSASARAATADELLGFFRSTAPMVRCVILDACCTREQSAAIARQVACVIGTSSALSDEAALTFTQVLYQGLADGRPVGDAFTRAKNAITRLTPRDRHAAPVIRTHPGTRRQCLTG
jgi:hypothetical protein